MFKRTLVTLAALALVVGIATPAAAQNFSSVAVLNGSCSAPSFTFYNDTDSGFYLVSAGVVAICINGAEVARINSNGISSSGGTSVNISQSGGTVDASTASYAADTSEQALSGDLNLAAGAGTSTAGQMRYLAGAMGNVIRDGNLTDTLNTVAGVVGKYDITGTNSSVYPKAGLVGEVGGAKAGQIGSSADAAVAAVLGGDEGPVQARAAYSVDFQNTGQHNAGRAFFRFGVDLQGTGAHSGYMGANYEDGDIRLGGRNVNVAAGDNVVIRRIAAAPVNGASGTCATICGPGSLLIRTDNGTLYINTNTVASPTWTVVGSQT